MPKIPPKLLEKYPEAEAHTFFVIDGLPVVTKKELKFFVGVGIRTIERYEDEGMKRSDFSIDKLSLYDPVNSVIWKSKNKKQKFSPKKTPQIQISQESKSFESFLETLPPYKREIFNMSSLDYMDRLAKLRDIEKKEISNKKELGELIDKNNVDKNMASLAGMLMSSFVNYEKSAPAELENRSKQDIQKLIRQAHDNVLDELDTIIKKEFDCDETLYEVMGAVLTAISNGKTPKELIDGMS